MLSDLQHLNEFRLTADELREAGSILYGNQWQTDLARAINVDSRRVRDWLQGRRPIPLGVKHELIALLLKNSFDAADYARKLQATFRE